MTMRSWVLGLLIAATATPLTAQTPGGWCDRIQTMTAEPAVAGAHWGVAVTTLDGTPLCAIHDAQLFRPASNAKLFTVGAALGLLGVDDKVVTLVKDDGKRDGGTLSGNLRLVGSGDPFLSERPVDYQAHANPDAQRENPIRTLAANLAANGLKHVTGDIIGDDTAWPNQPLAPGWSADDSLWGYGAPVSALSVDDNKLTLTVTPGPSVGGSAAAVLQDETGYYTVASSVVTSAAHQPVRIGIERIPGSRVVRVFGTIPLGGSYSTDLAIEDPAEYAAKLLKLALVEDGVVVDGTARAVHQPNTEVDDASPLALNSRKPFGERGVCGCVYGVPCVNAVCDKPAFVYSPALSKDVTLTLKVSQNLHAELMLRRLGWEFGARGSSARGSEVVRQFWLNAGLRPNDFALFDGSGLSGHDLTTPRALAQVLVFAAQQPWFAGFKAALPIGGVDGSLAARFAGALKGRVFAKTGTLGESRALSGYVTTASGQTLVFSILVDNHLPGSSADRAVMDRMVEAIAASN